MNPIKMMKLKSEWEEFQKRHPKFYPFLKAASARGLQEGAVLSLDITLPDGQQLSSNLKLTKEDLQMLDTLRSMQGR